MTKTDRHITALACVVRGSHAGGCFCWRCFSRIHAIASSTRDGSGTCHLLICTTWPSLVLACFRFLVDHVSVPYCSTCQFLLAHVSCCHWITCHFFIGPFVIFLLVHMSISYLTMRHNAVHPRVIFLYVHVAWWFSSTCRIFNSPRVESWLLHVSCTGLSMYHIFIWSRGLS